MRINTEKVEKLNPCKDRFDNFTKNYPNFSGDLKSFLELENITYSDKVWVITRLFTKQQNVMWSILCAESVLHLFEEKYPEDKRPREAIEAAKILNSSAADSARSAADSAARSAADSAARSAAYSAARSAAYSAAYSADSAAYSADSAAYSARSAADSAAYSAARSAAYSARSAADSAADSAAEKEQETKNISFMLMCDELDRGRG